jgi:hypothetical protein
MTGMKFGCGMKPNATVLRAVGTVVAIVGRHGS